MKIILLAAGSDIHSVRWANQLCENGHEVHLCYLSNHKPRLDKFNEKVILHELLFPSPYGYYMNILQLKKIIKKVKPDIVNAHYASGYGTLGRLLNFNPYVLSVYGSDVYDFPYKNKINMSIIRKNLYSANVLASTSNAMAQQTRKLLGSINKNIFITPFGVDISKFSKHYVKKNDNEFVIGSVKKLAPKYGMKYGILAVHYLITELLKDELKIKYLIYGEGEERVELEQLVEKMEIQHIVEFGGRIPNDEVPNILNNFDVFIGNSILDSESFGVAVVEAMSCEVPVIVSDVAGFKEVVGHGEAGVIFQRKNYIELAEELYSLIKDNNRRSLLASKARERVVVEYNWFENVKLMETIYVDAINKKNRT